MEKDIIDLNGSAEQLYAAQGASIEENLGGYVVDAAEHPETNDAATASEIIEGRISRSRANTALKIAAGIGATAVTVALLVHKGRRLPYFNHD